MTLSKKYRILCHPKESHEDIKKHPGCRSLYMPIPSHDERDYPYNHGIILFIGLVGIWLISLIIMGLVCPECTITPIYIIR